MVEVKHKGEGTSAKKRAHSDRMGVSKRVAKPAKALYQTIASSPLYFEPQAPKKLHKKRFSKCNTNTHLHGNGISEELT